ncbi:MAG: efflux RND transporter periplasmic adaptor subunit [Syntrophales bacterium]|nr:efflux RND transporter periplasmic adaptor subunit [Syntrophales bacterium]
MRKKLISKKYWGVAVVLVVAALYIVWPGKHKKIKGGGEVFTVTKGNLERRVTLYGTVEPISSETVTAKFGARIKKVLFKDGDFVKKGTVLIQFNENDLRNKLETERSRYLKAKGRVEEVKNWQSSSSYISAKTSLETNRIQYEDSKNIYKENQELYKAKAISKQDLDRSFQEMNRNRANMESSEAAFVDTARKGNKDALREARAEFIAAEISFREAETALAEKDVLAPFSGVVTMTQQKSSPSLGSPKMISVNSSVSAGEILFTIANYDRLVAEVKVDEVDSFHLRPGQGCDISFPALPQAQSPGKVLDVGSKADDKGSFFLVRCEVSKVNPKLKVGLSAIVTIPMEEKDQVIVVPLASLDRKDGEPGVYLVEGKNLEFRPVKVGLTNNEMAEITEGLAEGEQILARVPARPTEEG